MTLKEIIEALKADEFAKTKDWTAGAKLVHDGIKEFDKLSEDQVKADPELKEAGRYLFTEQVPLYLGGERDSVITRYYVRKALAEMNQ